nr:hypothetical protein [Tanacetum cinerariifolium]
MDKEDDDEVTKELYDDVNVNLGNEDPDMTNADQGASKQQNVSQESGFGQVKEDAHVTLNPVLGTQKADEPLQSSSVSSDFTRKHLNLENLSLADNEIASLMETSARHAIAVPKITSCLNITIPPPPPFFNPLLQQATPTPTPITSEATTLFPSLLNFSYVFSYCGSCMDNKLGETIHKAIQSHNAECREEAHAEKQEYIDNVDSKVRTIIREEVRTQLLRILPKVVSAFVTPVIERNVTKSLEVVVLARSSSQPKSTYEAAASLSEFELTKILLDKMKENNSHLRADHNKKLYDALVESYNTDKNLFNTYGEVFTLKRSRDDSDKDQDTFTGSDRGTNRRKSSKEAESLIRCFSPFLNSKIIQTAYKYVL